MTAKAKNRPTWASRFQAEIDGILEIDFIEWDRVHGYVNGLDSLLERINAHGKTSPAQTLDLVLYFVEEIPIIFNNVHDECELAMFCCDLAESAVALMRKALASPLRPVARLIEAWLADANDTCRFDDVPDILAKARFSKTNRLGIAEVMASYVSKADKEDAVKLRGLADKFSIRGRRKVLYERKP